METERRYDRRRSRSRSRRSYSRSPSYRDKYRSHKSHKSKSRRHSRSSRRSRTPPRRKRIVGKKIFFTPSPERKRKRRVKSEMLFDPEAGFCMPHDEKEELKRMYTKPAPQIRPGDPTTTSRCFRCLLKGHRADVCPNEARCRGCRRVGHMEAECPDKPENKARIEAEEMVARQERLAYEQAQMAEIAEVERLENIQRKEMRIQEQEHYARKVASHNNYSNYDAFYFRSRSPEYMNQKQQAMTNPDTKNECDGRTVFVQQLASKIKAQDLFEFFSTVGKVNEVKIIHDKFTKKSRGIGYVEFRSAETLPLALSLNGQNLLNIPIVIQPSQAEKNKIITAAAQNKSVEQTPVLDIGNLHADITDAMIQKIFEPFGVLKKIEIMRNITTQVSKGYGIVYYEDLECARKAKAALNGFELAGKPLKVSFQEKSLDKSATKGDELNERAGTNMSATDRVALMAKLAAGTDMNMPQGALNCLNNAAKIKENQERQQQIFGHATTPCFQLANLFTPKEETEKDWNIMIRDDVLHQCHSFGGISHIYVDVEDEAGLVYLKAPNIQSAAQCVNSLHGRFFGGRTIKASFIPLQAYHYRFPESVKMTKPIPIDTS